MSLILGFIRLPDKITVMLLDGFCKLLVLNGQVFVQRVALNLSCILWCQSSKLRLRADKATWHMASRWENLGILDWMVLSWGDPLRLDIGQRWGHLVCHLAIRRLRLIDILLLWHTIVESLLDIDRWCHLYITLGRHRELHFHRGLASHWHFNLRAVLDKWRVLL